jgi:adenylate cyclase
MIPSTSSFSPTIPSFIDQGTFPLEILTNANPGLGHIQIFSDVDYIFRYYPLVAYAHGQAFPSFSLSIYQHLTGDTPHAYYNQDKYPQLVTSKANIPINDIGEIKLKWPTGPEAFPSIPIWKILEANDQDPVMHSMFKNNVVFVGSVASGAHDLRPSPLSLLLPGIYFHMNALQNLLEGNFFKHESSSLRVSLRIMISGTLFMILMLFFKKSFIHILTMVGLSLLIYFLDSYYFFPQGYDIKIFFCLFPIAACFFLNMFFHYLSSQKPDTSK